MLRPEAQAGIFGYNVTVAGVQQRQTVDLIALARGATARSPRSIRRSSGCSTRFAAARSSTGTINDTGAGNTLQYVFQSRSRSATSTRRPARVDFNLSDNHRLSGSYWWQRFTSTTDLLNNVDPIVPGPARTSAPRTRTAPPATRRCARRSRPNVVNELRGGWQWSPNDFFANVTPDQFDDQDGYALSVPGQHRSTASTAHDHAAAAQHDDVERRQHAELAARRAQPLDGRRLRRRVQPPEQLQRRDDDHARLRHEHRSGDRSVQRHELPVARPATS